MCLLPSSCALRVKARRALLCVQHQVKKRRVQPPLCSQRGHQPRSPAGAPEAGADTQPMSCPRPEHFPSIDGFFMRRVFLQEFNFFIYPPQGKIPSFPHVAIVEIFCCYCNWCQQRKVLRVPQTTRVPPAWLWLLCRQQGAGGKTAPAGVGLEQGSIF